MYRHCLSDWVWVDPQSRVSEQQDLVVEMVGVPELSYVFFGKSLQWAPRLLSALGKVSEDHGVVQCVYLKC